MTGDIQSQISCFASAYAKLTGFNLQHRGVFDHRERAWFDFIKAGFSIADLETVILHLKRGIREGKRNPGALRFSNLIERADLFGEELELAKAQKRNLRPAPTPRERVMQQARPVVCDQTQGDTAKPISFYIEQLREAAK